MIAEKLFFGPEKKVLYGFAAWTNETLSLLLFGIALFIIWVALKKDHALLKAVLLAWLVLP